MNNINIVEALSQIAREKNVDRDLVVQTLVDALVSAAKKRYGNTENYAAEIDPTTGQMEVRAEKTVVDEVEDPGVEIDLEDARAIDATAELGSLVSEELDLADFGRNAIQTAKQILIQRVREAERERIYEEFDGRVGQIETGTVQQISRGDIVMNLGRAEAAIPLKEQIRRERYRQGDSIRGLIYEVLKSSRGPQVLLSRAHPEFLKKLFAIEVPEISEGIVEIHAVSREPGERAKIAVSSGDERVDPVGACVGVKGSRVQAVVRELSGERIDIVPWSDEPEVFIGRALSPATVSRVIVDHRRHHSTVIVAEDQLSLAIGKSGQNSRLAVQLTGWGVDIITEDAYQDRRGQIEETEREFRRLPGVSELIALSLATSGFNSIEDVAQAPLELLQTVPGLEGEDAPAAVKRAAEAFVAESPDKLEVNDEDLPGESGGESEESSAKPEADGEAVPTELMIAEEGAERAGVEEIEETATTDEVAAVEEPQGPELAGEAEEVGVTEDEVTEVTEVTEDEVTEVTKGTGDQSE